MSSDSFPGEGSQQDLNARPAEPVRFASPEIDAHPEKPRVWSVFVVVVLTTLFYVIVSTVVFVVAALLTADEPLQNANSFHQAIDAAMADPRVLLSSAGSAGVLLLLSAIFAAALSPIPFLKRLNLRRPRIEGLNWLVAMAGALSFSAILIGMDGLGIIPDSPMLETLGDAITTLKGPWLLFGFLIVGVMPGINEELFFRGYLQTRLTARWGTFVGVLITALLFGLIHFDLVQGFFAGAMGVYLGYLTIWTRSIIPAMVCHSVNNSVSFLLLRFSVGIDELEGVSINVALIAAGVFAAVAASWYVRNVATGSARYLADAQPRVADIG